MNSIPFFSDKELDIVTKAFNIGHWRNVLINGSPIGLYADEVMDELLGTSQDMTPSQRLEIYSTRIHPDDLPVIQRYTAELNHVETEVVYRYMHPLWGTRVVRCTGVKAGEENGKVITVGMHQDITDKVHLEYEISEQDHILSMLTQRLYGFNLTLDIYTGKYSVIKGSGMDDVVSYLQATDDYSNVESILRKCVFPQYIDKVMDMVSLNSLRQLSKEIGFIGSIEYPTRLTDNSETEWHELNLFIEADAQKTHLVNVLGRNVTEMHRRTAMQADLEIAKASSKAKTQFLFNMSHDIRTPMNAIIGYTNLLEKHLDDKTTSLNYIKKIQASNSFLLALINNVLEMARIESGKVTLDENEWSIFDFDDSLVAVIEERAKAKNIRFVRNINVQHDLIICDLTKLREVYLNLLSNAIKYTPEGGSVILDINELPCPENPGYANYCVKISDTGIGMSPEYLPHLFDEFSRERTSTESKVTGSGLGMSITKRLVELMHGSIEVESQIGVGTTFTVTFPHRIVTRTTKATEEVSSNTLNAASLSGKRILLAEDNNLNAEIAIAILEEFGISVDLAPDGKQCINMLSQAPSHHYDLVLMDVQMPVMNGYDAARNIRKLPDPEKAQIPIVAMTANAFAEDKHAAIECGMNDHLAKPINVNDLMQTLVKLLN